MMNYYKTLNVLLGNGQKKMTMILFFLLFSVLGVNAQNVTVTGCTGAGNGSYPTLSAAATAIVAAQPSAVITIAIVGDTTEPAAGATFVAGTWTSLTIQPSGGVARTISGAATAGAPLISFDGSDNVTINGLNSGGDSLTISNTTASATAGTCTIRFQNDATSNTITNCSILGSASSATGTIGANIYFGTTTGTTGNDNNTISNCNLGPAGSNLPAKLIYFGGSSNTDPGTANSGISVTGNNFFDYFGAAVSSAAIDVNSGTTNISITNNKFYQTASRTQTTGANHNAIRLNNGSGNNYTVTGNTIGFASSSGTGTYAFVGISSSSVLIPIFVSVGTTTASNINNNTISGLSISGPVSGTSSSASFRGIYVSGGLAICNGNTIGSQTATGSITLSSSSASAADLIGIFNFGSSNWTTNNNIIGGLSASNSSTGAANVYGIRCNTGSTVTWTCTGNTIGGTVANSLSSTSTATGTTVEGILNSNPIGTFTGNTIRNLSSAGGTGTTTTASVIGICITSTANQTVGTNTIFNLSNTNTSAATVVTGIQMTGSTANTVERNLIYGLTSATTSATAEINGIRSAGGTTAYRNNMIAIGAGVANAIGTAATNSGTTGINGIMEAGGTNTYFHNTVYIGGTATAGSGPSYAFNGTVTTNTRSFRDNIFQNSRTNSGATGKHYSIKINGTAANPAGLTINNNIYFGSGVGYVFGFFNSLDVTSLGSWKTAVGQDAGSSSGNPQLLNPTNATPDLHINASVASAAEASGADVSVTLDFDGQTRSGLTPVDIGADAGNFIALPVCSGTPASSTITGVASVCTGTSTSLSLSQAYNDLGITYLWKSSTTSGGPYTNLGTNATQATGNLTVTTYYVCDIVCNGTSTFTTPEKTITINALPTVSITPSSASYCNPGTAVSLTGNGASTYSWAGTGAPNLSATTGTTVTASPAAATTITVTGTDANGCVNTGTASISVAYTPTGVTATATPATICTGNTSALTGTVNPPSVTALSFSASTGATLDPMTGATTVIAANTTSGGTGDDTPSAVLTLPFTFNLSGVDYTQYSISPDGWIRLGGTAAAAEFTNVVTSTANLPKIYPMWDDISTGSDGNAKVVTTGSSPNRIFKIQWFVTSPRSLTGAANSTFQLWLYETTNKIEFRYGNVGVSGSASAGVTAGATNFQSITFTTNSASNVTANDSNAVSPTSGTMYAFTPPTYTYAWTAPTNLVSPTSLSTATTALTANETFSLVVSNGSCSSTAATASVTIASGVLITTDPVASVKCAGQTATFTVAATGAGLTYQWTKNGVDIATAGNPSAGTATLSLTNLSAADAATYAVRVSSTCGSPVTSAGAALTVNPIPTVNASPSSATYCIPGASPINITATGADTYSWSPSTGLSAATGASVTATPSATTTYTVTATITATGCTNTATSVITVSPAITATATATPSSVCANGNAQLLVTTTPPAGGGAIKITEVCLNRGGTGGGVYPAFAPGADLVEITNVSSSPVDVSGWTLTDHATNTTAATHTGFAFPASTIIPGNSVAVVCLGTGTNDTANRYFNTGGTSDFWLSSGLVGIVLKNGSTIVDAVGCGSGYVFNAGTGVTATDWSGAAAPSGSGLAGTTRTAAADNNTGADWIAASTTSVQTIGVYNAGFNPPIVIQSYAWSPATFLSATNVANPLASAVTSTTAYSVLVTTADGCSATSNATITVSPFSGLAATKSATQCAGSNFTVTANVTGGGAPYTYSWSDGTATTYPTTATITANKPAGTYNFDCTVTDSCGGTVHSTLSITVNPLPTVTLVPSTASICLPGGSAVALTAGGADTYTYTNNSSLTPTTGANVSANPSLTTTYVVTGTTTATGCTNTASATVTVSSKPSLSVSPASASTCSGASTVLTANAIASLEDVLGRINNNSAGLIASVPTATSFAMDGTGGVNGNSITDGCSDMYDAGGNTINTNLATAIQYSDNVVLSNPTAFGTGGKYFTRFIGTSGCAAGPATIFYMAADVNGITSFGTTGDLGADGGGTQDLNTFTVTSGGLTYNCYLKRVSGASDPSVNQLFMIPQPTTATQAMGASTGDNIHTLTNLSGVTRVYYMLYAGAGGGLISVASATTIAQTFADAITPSPTYAWSTGASTQSITVNPTSTTTYSVTATANGCTSDPTNVTITVSPLTGAPATASATKCSGSNFTVTANVSGGGTPYTYSWSDGSATSYPTTATITANKPAGTYTFVCTIGDACGGTTTSSVTVTVNPSPTVNITSVPANAVICGTGTVALTASGGVTYAWTPSSGLSATTGSTVTASATSNASVVYTATTTDANGCIGVGTKTVFVRSGVTGVTANANPTSACQGVPVNLTSSATTSGYTLDENSNVSFIDISGTGTSVGTPADDSEHNITIPSFTFNGTAYTTARVGNNGVLVFGVTTGEIPFTNSSLPQGNAVDNFSTTGIISGSVPVAALAVNWDDQTPSTTVTTSIKTQTVGNIFVIQWQDEDNFNATGTGTISYQIQLNLTTGQIHYVYNDITYGAVGFDGGGSATIGLNYSATSALQFSFNESKLSDLQSLTFTPNTITSYGWTGPNSYTASTQNPTFTATNASAGSYVVTATSNSGCSGTASATVSQATASVSIGTQPVTQTKCQNQSVTFTVVATGGGLTYQWYKGSGTSNPLSNGGRISGATSASLTINNLVLADNASYHVVVTSCSTLTQDSDAATLTVNPAPNVTVSPIATTVCNTTTPVSLTANGAVTYTWSAGTTPSTGANVSATATTTTTYTVTGADAIGCTATATATITVVNAPPTVTAGATQTTICGGASTNLTANSGAETAQYTYTWYYASDSGFTTPLGTGTSLTVTPPVVLPTTGSTPPYAAPVVDYRVVAVKGDGSCGAPAIGNVSITINTDPIGQITSNATSLCLGTGANPTSPALIDFNGEFSNTVTWISSNTNVATIDGNGNIITNNATSVAGTTTISAQINNLGTGCTTTSANTVVLSVYKPVVVTTQPDNVSIFQGGTASFTSAATGSGPTTPTSALSYQWYVSNSVNGVGTAIVNNSTYSGATTPTLTITNAPFELNQMYFYVVVTGSSVCSAPIETDRGILTVDPYTVSNPSNVTKCYDSSSSTPLSATFTVETNMDLTDSANLLVWKYSTGGNLPSDFNEIVPDANFSIVNTPTATPGLYQSVLTFTNITATNNNWKFKAEITPFPSETVLASSAAATLTVNTAAEITSTPTTSTVCYSAGTASFTVAANNAAGYQWQFTSATSPTEGDWVDITAGNASTLTTGATYSNYTTTTLGVVTTGSINASGTFKYRARVASQSTCPAVPSGVYQLFINTPTAAVTPSSATYCNPGGAPVVLDATAAGITSYSWSTGASTPTISVSPTTTTTYTVTVADGTGCSKQASATVTVVNGITVAATATPSIFCSGSTVQLNGAGTIVTPTLSSYIFTTSTGATLDAMTGASTVIASGTVNAGAGDNSPSTVQNIGFTFNFNGTNYTQYSVTPDGFIRLGATVATSEATNSVVSTNNLPKLYPLWDDIATGSNGNVKALVTGAAPNRILKLQWFVTVPRALTGTANSTFQAWLYENTNVIEYRYGTMGTAASASIGATAAAANFQSVTVASNTASTSTAVNNNATSPASGRMYRFAPSSSPFTYAWTAAPSATITNANTANASATPTATTVYTLTVTNGGCSASNTVTATLQDNPSITDEPREAIVCAGQTATFSVTATGPGLTYQWYKGAVGSGVAINTTSNPSAATATLSLTNVPFADNGSTYYVIVTSSCGPTSTATSVAGVLTVNQLPTVNVNSGSICMPGGTPITLTASGADTYAWSPATGLSAATGATVTASPSATTVYTVTGTNATTNCTNTATSTVTVSPSITATATATPANVCSGGNSVLNVTTTPPVGGSAIRISEVCLNRGGTGGGVYPAFAPGADLVEITNVSSSPVDVSGWTLTDHATNTTAATHTGFAFPASTVIPANSVAVVCLGTGTNDTANRYFNTGGTSDFWLSSGLVGIVLKNGSTVVDAVGCGSGYVFNAGTGVTATDWSGAAAPSGSGLAGTTRTAASDNNTGADWSAASTTSVQTIGVYNTGYNPPIVVQSYTWSPGTFLSATNVASPTATAVTATTTYSVTVVTTSGCSSTSNVTLNVSPFTGLAATASATRCANGNFTVTANASGGGSPYTYSWSDGTATTYPATATITANKPAGTYLFDCTITDTCGGTVHSQVSVTVNALPTIAANAGSICNPGGSAVSLTATGGSTYAWSPATGLSATTGTTVSATPSLTTTYTVTGTDANGCINTGTTTVTVVSKPTGVTATATPSSVCPGGITTLSATGSIAGTAPTYCSPAFTSSDGTDFISNVSVLTNADVVLFTRTSGATAVPCYDDQTALATTTLTAGTTYKVSATIGSAADNIVIGLDYNQDGDFADANETIQASAAVASLGTITATFTVPNTAYNGTARLRVVERFNTTASTDCTAISGFGEAEDYNLTISGATNNPANPTANFSWTGQATTLVSPNSQSTATNALSTVDGSTEIFTVTASHPNVPTCTAIATTTVTISNTSGTAPVIGTQPAPTSVCAGQPASFTVAATGTALTYQWFKNGVAINTATNPSAATATLTLASTLVADNGAVYTVQVNSNCAATTTDGTAVLTVKSLPAAAIAVTETSGFTNNDGTICTGDGVTLTASGGGTYSWSTSETSAAITPTTVLGANTYTVTVTTNGCSSTASSTVTVLQSPTAPVVSSNSPVCAGNAIDLTATVAPITGVSSYSLATTSGTYTPIAGGTVVASSSWDDTGAAIAAPIGFNYTFNGVSYTTCNINLNGYVSFGTTTSTTNYSPISTLTTNEVGIIAGFGRDLQGVTTTGEVRYLSTATEFIVQWSNARRYNSTTTNAESFNFQIHLVKNTNQAYIVYGTFSNAISANSAALPQVGLRGAAVTDFNNISVLNTGNWSSPASGGNNTASAYYNEGTVAVKPSSGLTYTFTPSAYTYAWSGPNSFTSTVQNPSIANATAAAAGSYSLQITHTNGCKASASTSVTINPLHTIALSSGSATQTVCINTPSSAVAYNLGGGATGATVSGLPAGMSGSTNAGVYTISGTPTASGTFNFTVTTTGNSCTAVTATGTVTVSPNNTVALTSGVGTNAQTVFVGSPITNITYTTTGATGATFSGLPTGVSGNWASNVVTISGSPSVIGTANYTVTLTGGCGNVTATGSITAASLLDWYLDADGDHYYTGTAVSSGPSPGPGYTTVGLLGGGDCADNNAAINPGATEICYNNIDDNCNTILSEGCAPVVVNMTPSYNNTTLPSLATAVPAVTYTYAPYTNLKYRFKITNLTTGAAPVEVIQASRYVTIPASLHAYNCQYTITASAVINEEVVPYAGNTITVSSPSVTLITLTSANCGATLASLTSTLAANPGLNATGYTFRIRLNDTNPSPTYAFSQSGTRFINANSFTGFPLQYSTSYKVSVQFTFNDPVLGSVQSGYGAECVVNTPGIPLISMASPTCGSQVSAMNANISSQVGSYATGYQFRIRLFNDNGPTPTYYYSVPNASRFSSLTAFQGITLAYNTAYSISVQYSILNGSTTVWSGYGPECKVTTPFFPVTSLVPSQCGLSTATSLTQQLNITPYPGFPHYMVKLEEISGESVVNSQEIEIAYSYFRLNQFSIAQLGKNYAVSVKIKLNGVFGDYDTACDLFTPTPAKTDVTVPFSAVATPNPFANNFTLNVKSSCQSNVNVKVYDMIGRLIEERDARVSDMETTSIGDRYPSGVYNVVVSQDDTVQTVRVVKR